MSQVDYWRQQLEGVPSLLELPTSKLRPNEPSGQAHNVPFVLAGQLFGQMKSVATSLRASPIMLLIAAFQVGGLVDALWPTCPDVMKLHSSQMKALLKDSQLDCILQDVHTNWLK